MKTDLHIHSSTGSDGKMSVDEIFQEARKRGIGLLSITDHDAIDAQERAQALARHHGIRYLVGMELNVSFSHPDYREGKAVSLDFLAYGFDIHHRALNEKLRALRDHRRKRAEQILENINQELTDQGRMPFTKEDLEAIEETVDGAFGRPHIANYMVDKGIVSNRQEAFDKYLVKCDVPKMPLSLPQASELVAGAGGVLILAHANDPNGTSLVSLSNSLEEQEQIIKTTMLPYIQGLEIWHTRHDQKTLASYLAFVRAEGLMATGGSDCHQQPVIMGNVNIPDWVADQF